MSLSSRPQKAAGGLPLFLTLGGSFLFLLATGCETLMTREGVREAEQKQEISAKVTNLQKTTADVNSRFADLDADQRQLNGRVEVVENRLGQAALERDKQKKQTDDQIAELQKKVQVMQDEIAKLNDTIAGLASEVANVKTSADGATTPAAGKEGPYEIAEDFFAKKDFKKAILNYQKFRDARPKDKKIANATYKIGVSFQELGMKDEAKTFYQEVVAKYPTSLEAQKCKIRLKKLK